MLVDHDPDPTTALPALGAALEVSSNSRMWWSVVAPGSTAVEATSVVPPNLSSQVSVSVPDALLTVTIALILSLDPAWRVLAFTVWVAENATNVLLDAVASTVVAVVLSGNATNLPSTQSLLSTLFVFVSYDGAP